MKTLSFSLIISVLTIVFVLSCSSIEIDDDFFECTVDYVEFIDESNAIVRFETTLGKETNYYYGRYTYTKNGSEYLIGDNMVNIRGFESKKKYSFLYFRIWRKFRFLLCYSFRSIASSYSLYI